MTEVPLARRQLLSTPTILLAAAPNTWTVKKVTLLLCGAVVLTILTSKVQQLHSSVSVSSSTSYLQHQLRGIRGENRSAYIISINVDETLRKLRNIIGQPFVDDVAKYKNKSLLNYGDQSRLHRALLLAMSNKTPLRFAAIGGSITAGHGVSSSAFSYIGLLEYWFAGIKSDIDVSFINAAIPGSGSEHFAHCIREFVDLSRVDVLLVEFSLNDHLYAAYMPGYRPDAGRPLEELVRAIWKANPFVHIVLINFPVLRSLFLTDPPVCASIEDAAYLDIARHYNLTSVYWKHMFCRGNESLIGNKTEQKTYADRFYAKDRHPNNDVHRHMAEFVAHYFQSSAKDLFHQLQQGVESQFILDGSITATQTFKVLSKPPVNSKTVWIAQSQCFSSFSRPDKKSQRLRLALTGDQNFRIEQWPTAGFNAKNFTFDESEHHYDILMLDNQQSVSMQIKLNQSPKCQSRLRLFIIYKICGSCGAGKIAVSSTFMHGGIEIFRKNFETDLPAYGFSVNIVKELQEVTMLCQSRVSEIYISITQIAEKHSLWLHGISAAYECCSAY